MLLSHTTDPRPQRTVGSKCKREPTPDYEFLKSSVIFALRLKLWTAITNDLIVTVFWHALLGQVVTFSKYITLSSFRHYKPFRSWNRGSPISWTSPFTDGPTAIANLYFSFVFLSKGGSNSFALLFIFWRQKDALLLHYSNKSAGQKSKLKGLFYAGGMIRSAYFWKSEVLKFVNHFRE